MEQTSNTLDELIGRKNRVYGHCRGCARSVVLDLEWLKQRKGGAARIGDLAAKMTCRDCGRHGVELSIQGR